MALKFLEARGIERVPESERYGKPNSLLSLWFMSNAQIVVIAYGAAIVGLGLSLLWVLAAIVVGTVLGTPIMAYHSAQGPKLGLPQMIQSRAQFGLIGAALPTLLAFVLYVVFAILGGSLLGPAVGSILHLSADAGIVIFNIACLIVAWAGYKLIHSYNRIMTAITLALFAALLVKLVLQFATGTVVYHATGNTVANFVLAVAISATNQITWSPYVSDYSRYLPKSTSIRKAFWYTAVGAGLGAVFSEVIGALAGFVAFDKINTDAAGYLSGIFHGGTTVLLLVLILGALPGQIESIYGAFLTGFTTISPSGKFGNTVALRIGLTTAVTAIATVVAIAAHSNVLDFLLNMSVVLLYLLIPWTAINLTDFYFVRKGRYDLHGFFNSATYGTVNWRTLAVYLAGFAFEIPFINASFFTGPRARFMDGADISWLVGFLAASALYVAVSRNQALAGSLDSNDATARVLPASRESGAA